MGVPQQILLCSELSAYPVADAVAASSAVPVLFNPVVVANYDTCSDMKLIGTTRLHATAEMYEGQNLPVVISQLETNEDMDLSNKEPSAVGVVGAVTNLQLTRYDVDSMLMTRDKIEKWAAELSTPERPVKTHFIDVSIQKIKHPEALAFFNAIPTSFALKGEQVDKLIEAGRQLLRENPEFQKLLADLNSQ